MAMDSHHPLTSILNRRAWYPKSNRYIPVQPYDPLVYQFLNLPQPLAKHSLMFPQTPLMTLRTILLVELVILKSNYIRSISGWSHKLLQISLLSDRVPRLDCDAVLTAPASHQANFLAWRDGSWGWGRKYICGKRFDRGHTSCMPSPAISLTETQKRLFALGYQLLDPPIKYTLVDFLLNEHLGDKARYILDFWNLSISYLLKVKPPRQ